MLIGETEAVQKETECLIKKALYLTLNEEGRSKKLKFEELLKGVNIIDFEPDNKYMQDDLIDIELMFEPQQEQEENKDEEKAEGKSSTMQLVNTPSIDTQTASITKKVSVNIDESQKEKIDDKKDEEAPLNFQPIDNQPPSVKESINEKKDEAASVNEQNVDNQPPPVKDTTEKDKIEKEKTKKVKVEKKETEEKRTREKKTTPKITPESKKKIIDDDDDVSVSIKGPIDMDNLSSSQLMEIARAMKSRAQNKRMKEQRRKIEIIRTIVDILSSLLPKTDTKYFITPMDKLGQLITDARDQLKTFEEVAYIRVEKCYKKKRAKQLMFV
ncbi:uncharacterized protein LOC131857340 [Cryptomeria japonica]|uniref:uncharacterized protein LOC131857340 n=1 Tax=Cryptomeria japonica TaxID=3369 RepID=UPI0027D9EE21|nr:uncharacterized protein LOC131857340 [Cryptomeria japonica]